MINRPATWDDTQAASFGGGAKLPPGGYVITIRKAEIKISDSGYQYLDLSVDIAEGEWAGFYLKDWSTQTGPNKRWKGHYRQGIPVGDTQRDSYFKGMISAIEESNAGYTWDWNEQSLVGKVAGCLFREEEYDFNGYHGFTANPFRMTGADKIRKGAFQIPARRMLNQGSQQAPAPTPQPGSPEGFEGIDDDSIPF